MTRISLKRAAMALMLVAAWTYVAECSPNKFALVIGNSDYSEAPLRNPVNDAEELAAVLERLGFSVTVRRNVACNEFEEAIREFGRRLRPGDVGLFYFSGHGVQVDGINYLIPVGASIQREHEIKYKAINACMILDEMEHAGSSVNIIILDACRNNPFTGFRAIRRGLAPMTAPSAREGGTLIAYATGPGSVARDGQGRLSPYAKHLIETMKIPGIEIEKVFKHVRLAVIAETNREQIPWEASSLTTDFCFAPAPSAGATPELGKTQQPAAVQSSTTSPPAVLESRPPPRPAEEDWLVILGSFPKTQSDEAHERLTTVKAAGYEAYLVDTDNYPALKEGLLAVVMGPYSKGEAQTIRNRVRAVVSDAYIKMGR